MAIKSTTELWNLSEGMYFRFFDGAEIYQVSGLLPNESGEIPITKAAYLLKNGSVMHYTEEQKKLLRTFAPRWIPVRPQMHQPKSTPEFVPFPETHPIFCDEDEEIDDTEYFLTTPNSFPTF